MRKFLLAAGAAALISGCGSNPTVSWLGGTKTLAAEEVRTLFVGNTVESHNRNTRLNSITYYHPNGQAVQQRLWSQRLGKWVIEEDGRICLAFGDRPMKCRHIVKEGDRYFKVRHDAAGNPEKIVRYRFFANGNLLERDG
jgi:hypothetical protein